MNLPQAGRWMIIFTLIIVGIIFWAYLSGMFFTSPAHNPGTGRTSAGGFTITTSSAYCFITEYNATRATGANLIPLTGEDFREFPEFTQWMNGTTGSAFWYNDVRSAGDFNDCGGRFHTFLNLSCRNLTPEECASPSKKTPDLFVHDGRYYSVTCLPGFGMYGHPGAPANMTTSCP
jgi:hypothetical protein